MRRAFVMGSNGPADLRPLQFARDDARMMEKILTDPRCNFVVTTPNRAKDTLIVRRHLYAAAEACQPGDEFLCYFSGHGLLERGSLFLLWDNANVNQLLRSTIPLSDVLEAMKLCKAENKLLILDCCHAGAVVSMSGFKSGEGSSVEDAGIRPENFVVLMASNRLEKARELDSLRGGFMTQAICSALTSELKAADSNSDGRVSVNELQEWLERRAQQHNAVNPSAPVPIPFLFGQLKGEFYLTGTQPSWTPYELIWPDGSVMVVLPRPSKTGKVAIISKYPVTNAQYKRFVENAGAIHVGEPCGDNLRRTPTGNKWDGPFYPWREDAFNAPDQPVVCVSYKDASAYCHWVSGLKHGGRFR